jgi:mannosyltransferase OCH1-like enzyme
MWLVTVAVSVLVVKCLAKHSGLYHSCSRGSCAQLSDRELDWEWDQPQPFYVESLEEGGSIRSELGVGRIHTRYQSRGEDEVECGVPASIHLVWVGSPLPDRYLVGPQSLAMLNPEHTVHLWVDHTPHNIKEEQNIRIHHIQQEVWMNEDLMAECTNYAMKSDILRLEIVYRYGGIYVDVDAVALRSFGPAFSRSFLCFRPANWTSSDQIFSQIQPKKHKIGSAGIENNIFGFPAKSNFLKYALSALRENFWTQSSTLYRTGPVFLKEVFLQYPYSHHIPLLSWDYAGSDSEHSVVVDLPGNADWDDGQDVRERRATVVTLNTNTSM